ncbi:Outer membrane protein/protective antigen OMA87 [Serratia quinivorans]|uniref:BamA/TamA family outer membrane protein n=1 Tax=Serratia quinivorans TaxID=137545 RepID=UPI002179E62A|nr:BamA/TamA family outer membrane protein [Serratia quinivorans]CAI1551081.1 Outer membrane protein/protective antigen OMA87 [Serratia quinivorans]
MTNLSALLVLASCLVFPSAVQAAGMTDAEDGMLDMGEYMSDNRYGFLPVPVVITEPAVGYGGGLFGLFLHDSGQPKATPRSGRNSAPPAISAFGGGATQNGTWFVGGGHRHTWNNDAIRYLVAVGYADINLDIYSGDIAGFGGGHGVSTQTKGYGGTQKLLFRLADTPFFVGGSQFYARTEISADNPVISQALQRVLGESSSSSGLGLVMEYDTTDNFFYPRHGLSASAEYQFYTGFLGGDYRYDMLTLDGKYFHPLGRSLTLAIAGNYQSLSNYESHLTPLARPYIKLRGIPSYRYQGDYVAVGQTQLEWQVTPRWVVQGFVGAGSASRDAQTLFDKTEVAWGGGFRYLIARKFGLHTGIDVAFSNSDRALYFNVGSGL